MFDKAHQKKLERLDKWPLNYIVAHVIRKWDLQELKKCDLNVSIGMGTISAH